TDPITEGQVGFAASAFAGNTNTSPELRFRLVEIVTPLRMTVCRSVNGLVTGHGAGLWVGLNRPAIIRHYIESDGVSMPFPQLLSGQTITADRLNAAHMKMVAQSENQEVVNSTALVPTEIIIPLESGATYWYQLVLTYTASNTGGGMGGGGIRWAWDVPTGTSMPRQTASYALVDNQAISLIAGGRILLRSPAATTEMRAEGSGPDNFHAALEYGS